MWVCAGTSKCVCVEAGTGFPETGGPGSCEPPVMCARDGAGVL